jgi:hypothetical protein
MTLVDPAVSTAADSLVTVNGYKCNRGVRTPRSDSGNGRRRSASATCAQNCAHSPHRSVAQHCARKNRHLVEVFENSQAWATVNKHCAHPELYESMSVRGYEPEGRVFESLRAHHKTALRYNRERKLSKLPGSSATVQSPLGDNPARQTIFPVIASTS